MPIVAQLPNQFEAVLVRHPRSVTSTSGHALGMISAAVRAVRDGDDCADLFQQHQQYMAGVGLIIYDQHVADGPHGYHRRQ
jgi:hypothetical protein